MTKSSIKFALVLLAVASLTTFVVPNPQPRSLRRRQLDPFCGTCLWHDGRSCDAIKDELFKTKKMSIDQIMHLLTMSGDNFSSPCVESSYTYNFTIEDTNSTFTDNNVTIIVYEDDDDEVQMDENTTTANDNQTITFYQKDDGNVDDDDDDEDDDDNQTLLDNSNTTSEAKKTTVFCFACKWEGTLSCFQQLQNLAIINNTTLDHSKEILLESGECRDDSGAFCKECVWGGTLTCKQRLINIMTVFSMTETEAADALLKKGYCSTKTPSRV